MVHVLLAYIEGGLQNILAEALQVGLLVLSARQEEILEKEKRERTLETN